MHVQVCTLPVNNGHRVFVISYMLAHVAYGDEQLGHFKEHTKRELGDYSKMRL